MYNLDDLDRAILAHLAAVGIPQTISAVHNALRRHTLAPSLDQITSRMRGMYALSMLSLTTPPTKRPSAYALPSKVVQEITLSPSQSAALEALVALGPSTSTQIQAHLAGQGITYPRRTIANALSGLALHGLACVVGKAPAPTPNHVGPPSLVWQAAEREVPADVRTNSRREWTAARRIKAILDERGPTPAGELARAARVNIKRVVLRCRTIDAYIIRTGWTEPRSVRDDEPKRGYVMIGLAHHRDALCEALRAHMSAVASVKAQLPRKTKPKPAPKPRPEPKPKPALESKPKAEKPKAEKPPKVQTPKPAPCPAPPKPTPAQVPQPRALLTPDMSPAERIERIRAHFARALPRLRRDGSVTHLHLRDGQLRHRARD